MAPFDFLLITLVYFCRELLSSCACVAAICTPACSSGEVCKAPPHTCECLQSDAGGRCLNGEFTVLAQIVVMFKLRLS